jgi:hypothetical protein
MHAFKAIAELEGVRGLWKGTVPNMQRAAILTASQLSSYDAFKHAVLDRGWMREGLPLHAVSSMFAGTVCALTTAPVDNVKTRLMNQMVDSAGRGMRCACAQCMHVMQRACCAVHTRTSAGTRRAPTAL